MNGFVEWFPRLVPEAWVSCLAESYYSELATDEKALFALLPIWRTVPTTSD